jgi:hypothetical protein
LLRGEYHPAYLPENLAILVGKNAERLMSRCSSVCRLNAAGYQAARQSGVAESQGDQRIAFFVAGSEETSEVMKAAVNARLINIKRALNSCSMLCGAVVSISTPPVLPAFSEAIWSAATCRRFCVVHIEIKRQVAALHFPVGG